MKKTKNIPTPAECQFEADGKVFCFNAPKIEVNTGEGYRTLTAQQLVETEGDEYVHADVLAHLVTIGSGCIEVVDGKSVDKPATELTVKELKILLDEAGVLYSKTAKKAELVVLAEDFLASEEENITEEGGNDGV